jgi:hypothetical protein
MDSIPIARSISPLIQLPFRSEDSKRANWPEFWPQLGPNFVFPTSDFPARFFGLTSGWAPLRPVFSFLCRNAAPQMLPDLLSLGGTRKTNFIVDAGAMSS